jgi:hypothetical protein
MNNSKKKLRSKVGRNDSIAVIPNQWTLVKSTLPSGRQYVEYRDFDPYYDRNDSKKERHIFEEELLVIAEHLEKASKQVRIWASQAIEDRQNEENGIEVEEI